MKYAIAFRYTSSSHLIMTTEETSFGLLGRDWEYEPKNPAIFDTVSAVVQFVAQAAEDDDYRNEYLYVVEVKASSYTVERVI